MTEGAAREPSDNLSELLEETFFAPPAAGPRAAVVETDLIDAGVGWGSGKWSERDGIGLGLVVRAVAVEGGGGGLEGGLGRPVELADERRDGLRGLGDVEEDSRDGLDKMDVDIKRDGTS